MSSRGKVFILDDDRLVVSMLSRALRKDGYEVEGTEDPRSAVDRISAWSPDVVMLDINLPGADGLDLLGQIRDRGIDTQVVMLTGDATADTATRSMKLGASDYVTKPFDLGEVRLVIANLTEKQHLKKEVDRRRREDPKAEGPQVVGSSSAIRQLREQAQTIAQAGVGTVLITGESRTGKEVLARSIHRWAHGDDAEYAPFVGVNCTAVPGNLIENELFGHEKGAFTDARTDQKGMFELAEGGTLLLDEIGDMPFNLQAKLLRVLEERTVRRIGGKVDIPVNATVLATTNRDLAALAQRGEFRSDLFYRLSGFALHVPPLRERGEDVLELAEHFRERLRKKYGKKRPLGFSEACRKALLGYPWPGNVRELRNVIERIVVLEGAEVVGTEHLPREMFEPRPAVASAAAGFVLPEGGISLEDVKRDLMVQALARAGNNKAQAAKLLDLSYETLRYQLKRFGLD